MTNMTSKELKAMAKALGVKGWWTLNKADLIAAIEAIQNEQNDDDVADVAQNDQDQPESAEETTGDEVIDEETEAVQDEPETTEDKPETTENNGWEKIAKENIKYAYEQCVGENENGVTDGQMTQEEFDEWIKNDAIDTIYHEAIRTTYGPGYCGGKAPREMRFAGKKFCIAYIIELLKADGFEVEKKPRGKMIEFNGKSQTLNKWAAELGFTPQTLFARLYISNWPVEKAFTTPSRRKTSNNEEE